MSPEELRWLIGIALTVTGLVAGIAGTAFRAMSAKLDRVAEKMAQEMKIGDDTLHKRVNDTNKEIADRYVRRDDLEGHLERIDGTMREIRGDLKELIRQGGGRRPTRG